MKFRRVFINKWSVSGERIGSGTDLDAWLVARTI
jgi:hypothetical protein